MSMSTVRPSTPPLVSLEVKSNTRALAPWQLPLYRQHERVRAYTPEELADMYAIRHDGDVIDVEFVDTTPTHAAFAQAPLPEIEFCDACGEELPLDVPATDLCPHCGW